MEHILTNRQARLFLLRKQGLIGATKFTGKKGVVAFVKQAGCIQFDPVDVCGKNTELVLQARVKGFRKNMLYQALYKERTLLDYFDKQLAVVSMEDWRRFAFQREHSRTGQGRGRDKINAVREQVLEHIHRHGPSCSGDLGLDEVITWDWGASSKLARAALEVMYFSGELVVHHKNGTQKYYDLAERHIPTEQFHAPNPFPDLYAQQKWKVRRRIGSVGMLWNRPSDAFLGVDGMKAAERGRIFSELLEEGAIISFQVEGIKEPLHCLAEDLPLLEAVQAEPAPRARCELIAPLDNLLWDRKLISVLFGFDYKWEIYTPADQRKYGYYTLPILLGDRFIGRVEAVCNRKESVLEIRNVWLEDGVKDTAKLRETLDKCFARFAAFNECETIHRVGGCIP